MPREGKLDDRRIAAGFLLISVALVVGVFGPGLLHADSNQTIYQAATNVWVDWWTPFGARLLERWLEFQLGLGSVFVVQTGLVVLGLYLCFRHGFRRLPAGVLTLVAVVFPPMFAAMSNLSRDGFYLGFSLMAFGLVGAALRAPAGRRAGLFVAASGGSAIAAYLCRQNGIVLVFVVAFAAVLLWLWTPRDDLGRLRRAVGRHRVIKPLVAIAIAGCVSLVVVGLTSTTYDAVGVRSVHPERTLYLYDLAGMSTLRDRQLFPVAELRNVPPTRVTPADVSLSALEQRFNPINVITLFPDGAAAVDFANEEIAATEVRVLRDAWREAVLNDPLGWLSVRFRLMKTNLGVQDHPRDAYIGLNEPSNFNFPISDVTGYRHATNYVTTFVGADPLVPLDVAWTYLVLITVCCVVLWRQLRRSSLLAMVMTLAVWLNLAGLALVSMAASFRYMSLMVPVVLVLSASVLAIALADRSRVHALLDVPLARRAEEAGLGDSKIREAPSPEASRPESAA